jgi:hypothetical protein
MNGLWSTLLHGSELEEPVLVIVSLKTSVNGITDTIYHRDYGEHADCGELNQWDNGRL